MDSDKLRQLLNDGEGVFLYRMDDGRYAAKSEDTNIEGVANEPLAAIEALIYAEFEAWKGVEA